MSEKMQVVKGPDGKVHKFPQGTSFSDIDSRLRVYYADAGSSDGLGKSKTQGTGEAIAMDEGQQERADRYDNHKNSYKGGVEDAVAKSLGLDPAQARGRAANSKFVQGTTFGFSDEIAGGVAAGGTMVANAFRKDDKDFKESYANARDEERAINKYAETLYPKTSAGLELSGAVATGGTGLIRGSTVKVGAAEGAAYGAGTAEGGLGERAKGAGKGAAFGAAGGFVLGRLSDKAVSAFSKNPKMFVNGQITEQGEETLKRMGVDPKALTQDDFALMARYSDEGVPIDQAARIADAESLPVPVKLTQGQIRNDADTLRTELIAQDSGAFGQGANEVATRAAQDQQMAIQSNVTQIRRQMGGDGELVPFGEGGAQIASRISDDAAKAKSAAADMRAKANAAKATAPNAVLKNIVGDVRADMASNGIVKGNSLYDEINSSFLTRADALVEQGKRGEIPVQAIMRLRQDVSNASKNASSPDLGKIATQIDDAMMEAIDNAVIKGDLAAIKEWQKGTVAFKKYFQMYDGKQGAKKIIADIASGKTTPEQASGRILGRTNLGGPARAAETVKEVKKLIGEDAPEFQTLRQEALTRLVKADGADGRIGVKFASNLEDRLTKEGALMRELYSPDEILALRRLARVVRATNAQPSRLSNPSQSGLTNEIINRIGGRQLADLAKQLPVIRTVLKTLKDGKNARKIDKLVNQGTPETKRIAN